MKLYLAPESSLELIRYLRSTNGEDGLMGTPMRKRMLVDAINTSRGIDELDTTAHYWLEHAGSPIHALVPERAKGTSTKRLVTHVLGEPAPNGGIIDLGHNVAICSPQFAFMLMTTQIDLVDAVKLGMEFCGTYSRWRLEPANMGDPYYAERPESRACTFDVPIAMNLKRTESFVNRQRGHRGALGARAALRWMAEGSASPMETAVYLLLCLPKRLGGYGFPKPVLNPRLIVSNPDGKKERHPDLFWLGANIDIEYNSDEAHSGEWSRYRDSKREIELVVGNVTVLPLTRAQLMDAGEFDTFAQGLRRLLGIRARAADPTWVERRDALRQRLLADWL